jgi:hypothetical protein
MFSPFTSGQAEGAKYLLILPAKKEAKLPSEKRENQNE